MDVGSYETVGELLIAIEGVDEGAMYDEVVGIGVGTG